MKSFIVRRSISVNTGNGASNSANTSAISNSQCTWSLDSTDSWCSSAALMLSRLTTQSPDTTMGKRGQTSSFSLTGVLFVQAIRRFRRRHGGDAKTRVRHPSRRHTRTSVCHVSTSRATSNRDRILFEPHRNRTHVGGHRRGVCRLPPGLHRTSQRSLYLDVAGMKHTSTLIGRAMCIILYFRRVFGTATYQHR
jgi:hypothetical protein